MSLPEPTAARHLSADVVVIGAGIIGCSAAAILADRGARVIVVEGRAIGAGASGRNLGAIQHPFDPVLAPLYYESILRYQALAETTASDFRIGRQPAGLLLLNADPDLARSRADELRRAVPDLAPQALTPEELSELEPALAPGPGAVRLATGYPVPPAAATMAWADLAGERGAQFLIGTAGRPLLDDGRVTGVTLDDGREVAADAVLVAAGPWTPRLVDPTGAWQPMHPTYGVTLQLRLTDGVPAHVVEEDAVEEINRADAATAQAARAADEGVDDPPSLFSVASAAGISTLGSTFLPEEPDPARIEPLLLRRAERWMPSIADADVVERRMCARPQSVDGRPFIGPVRDVAGLFVCTGHGPWGISTGPASAAMAARAILDGTPAPPDLAATRGI